jgi:hypothetical protein
MVPPVHGFSLPAAGQSGEPLIRALCRVGRRRLVCGGGGQAGEKTRPSVVVQDT